MSNQLVSPLSFAADARLAPSAHKLDYEQKLWGAHEVEPSPRHLGGLKLKYCLEDLKGVTGKILEIGCGGGGIARAIKRYRPDLEVHGLDLSKSALWVALERGGNVSYGSGDAHRLPIAAGAYDAVVMLDTLEHLPDPQAALTEVCRILTPGGVFHLYCPLEGDVRNLHGFLRLFGWSAKERLIGHIQQLTESELGFMLDRANLITHSSKWSGHLINQLADIAYFSWVDLRGLSRQSSIETESAEAKGRSGKVINLLRLLIASTSYHESLPLSWIPGSGQHIHSLASYQSLAGSGQKRLPA